MFSLSDIHSQEYNHSCLALFLTYSIKGGPRAMLKEVKVDSTLRGKKKIYLQEAHTNTYPLSASSTLRELSFQASSATMNLRTKTH